MLSVAIIENKDRLITIEEFQEFHITCQMLAHISYKFCLGYLSNFLIVMFNY